MVLEAEDDLEWVAQEQHHDDQQANAGEHERDRHEELYHHKPT